MFCHVHGKLFAATNSYTKPQPIICSIFFVYYAFEECSKRLPINAQSITTAIITRFIYYLIIFMTRLA